MALQVTGITFTALCQPQRSEDQQETWYRLTKQQPQLKQEVLSMAQKRPQFCSSQPRASLMNNECLPHLVPGPACCPPAPTAPWGPAGTLTFQTGCKGVFLGAREFSMTRLFPILHSLNDINKSMCWTIFSFPLSVTRALGSVVQARLATGTPSPPRQMEVHKYLGPANAVPDFQWLQQRKVTRSPSYHLFMETHQTQRLMVKSKWAGNQWTETHPVLMGRKS